MPEEADISVLDFLPNPLVAIAPAGHPLTRRGRLELADLAGYPFLMREQGSGTRHAIDRHLRAHNVSMDVRMTIESNEAIKHAVMSGLGISILSAHTLTFGGSAGLAELEVARLPIASQWFLVRRRQQRVSLIADTFLEYLEAEGRDSVLAELQAQTGARGVGR